MKAGRNFIVGLCWVVVMGWGMGVRAQAPDTLWTRRYGGAESEWAYSVQQTTDDGFITAGKTCSFNSGGGDFYLVKTDSLGDSIWTHHYGGSEVEVAKTVYEVNGGYIIGGYTYSFGAGDCDIYVVRISTNGDTIWTKTYGGAGRDVGLDIQPTADGGCLIAGSNQSELYLVKINDVGDTLWTGTYGYTVLDPYDYDWSGVAIKQTIDNGFVVASTSADGGGYYLHLIKVDELGHLLWSRTYYGSSEGVFCNDIIQNNIGGFILVGVFITRDQWFPYQIHLYEYALLTDNQGEEIWDNYYEEGRFCSVVQAEDSGYVISSDAGFKIVKLRTDGSLIWNRRIEFGNGLAGARSISPVYDRGYIVAGYIVPWDSTYSDLWLVRTEPDTITTGFISPEVSLLPSMCKLHFAYPNPFNSSTTISYEVPVRGWVRVIVYDVLGRQVATVADGVVSPGSYSVGWEAGDLPSGIYFVRMEAGEFVQTRKVVLLK